MRGSEVSTSVVKWSEV